MAGEDLVVKRKVFRQENSAGRICRPDLSELFYPQLMNKVPDLTKLRLADSDGLGVKLVTPSDTLPEAWAGREVPLKRSLITQPGDLK